MESDANVFPPGCLLDLPMAIVRHIRRPAASFPPVKGLAFTRPPGQRQCKFVRVKPRKPGKCTPSGRPKSTSAAGHITSEHRNRARPRYPVSRVKRSSNLSAEEVRRRP